MRLEFPHQRPRPGCNFQADTPLGVVTSEHGIKDFRDIMEHGK